MPGLKFPLDVDPIRKNLVVVTDADLVKSQILSWLQTQPYERVMQPDYGLRDRLFEAIADVNTIVNEVREGLNTYVPDAEIEVTGAINELGECLITVFWSWLGEDQTTLQVII